MELAEQTAQQGSKVTLDNKGQVGTKTSSEQESYEWQKEEKNKEKQCQTKH